MTLTATIERDDDGNIKKNFSVTAPNPLKATEIEWELASDDVFRNHFDALAEVFNEDVRSFAEENF